MVLQQARWLGGREFAVRGVESKRVEGHP
jgi:hypothetical protein